MTLTSKFIHSLLFTLVVGLVFSIPHFAQAATVYEQTSISGVMDTVIGNNITSVPVSVPDYPVGDPPIFFQFWIKAPSATSLQALMKSTDSSIQCGTYFFTTEDYELLADGEFHIFTVEANDLNPTLCDDLDTFLIEFNGILSGGASMSNLAETIPYFIFTADVPPPIPVFPTRIDTVDPYDGETVATSTPTTFGATGRVDDADYVDEMTVSIRYYNEAGIASNGMVGPLASGGGQALCNMMPDWLCTPTDEALQTSLVNGLFEWDIDSAGSFSFSTTTTLFQVGEYTMVTQINRPTGSFLGFSFGSSVFVSTTTSFMVATTSKFDVFQNEINQQIDDIFNQASVAECTVDFSTAFGLTDFGDCITYLFTASGSFIGQKLQENMASLLSRAPWGYGTRVYVILTQPYATSTLPSLAFEIPEQLPMGGSTFDFSPWSPTESTVTMLSTTEMPNVEGTVMENFLHWWNIMWYVVFGLWLLREIYGEFGDYELTHEDNPAATSVRRNHRGETQRYNVVGRPRKQWKINKR